MAGEPLFLFCRIYMGRVVARDGIEYTLQNIDNKSKYPVAY
jgi:hypothetical protein